MDQAKQRGSMIEKVVAGYDEATYTEKGIIALPQAKVSLLHVHEETTLFFFSPCLVLLLLLFFLLLASVSMEEKSLSRPPHIYTYIDRYMYRYVIY